MCKVETTRRKDSIVPTKILGDYQVINAKSIQRFDFFAGDAAEPSRKVPGFPNYWFPLKTQISVLQMSKICNALSLFFFPAHNSRVPLVLDSSPKPGPRSWIHLYHPSISLHKGRMTHAPAFLSFFFSSLSSWLKTDDLFHNMKCKQILQPQPHSSGKLPLSTSA